MFNVFAGFNTPEVIIPVYALIVVFLSFVTWLVFYIIQKFRQKPLPNHLLIKTIIVYVILMTTLYIVIEQIK
jgi:predicted neutral ceramidase superfamily lipid hydrolase